MQDAWGRLDGFHVTPTPPDATDGNPRRARRIRRRRVVIPYPGGPIPPGYQLSSRGNWRLSVAGGATLGVSWLSAFIGFFASINCHSTGWFGVSCSSASPWLVVPIIGPWPALADTRHSALGNTVIVIDGIVQVAGLALIIAGGAQRHPVLETFVYARGGGSAPIASAAVLPYTANGGGGLVVTGTF